MARFRISSLFSNGTGKLGDNVISKGMDGVVGVRPRVTPANPQTEAQMAVRSAQTESSQAWETLSESQCEGWRAAAKLLPQTSNKTGLPIRKQGFNFFCSCYDRFRLVNPTGVFPKDVPATRMIEENLSFTLEAGTGQMQMTASGPNSAGHVTEILFQKLAGKNRLPQTGAYRTRKYQAFASNALTISLGAKPGSYAVATRIVSSVDGRAGRLRPVAVVQVALAVVQGGADEAAEEGKKAA